MTYFYYTNGSVEGPVEMPELVRMSERGLISDLTPIRCSGEGNDWRSWVDFQDPFKLPPPLPISTPQATPAASAIPVTSLNASEMREFIARYISDDLKHLRAVSRYQLLRIVFNAAMILDIIAGAGLFIAALSQDSPSSAIPYVISASACVAGVFPLLIVGVVLDIADAIQNHANLSLRRDSLNFGKIVPVERTES